MTDLSNDTLNISQDEAEYCARIDKEHVVHSWSAQDDGHQPTVITGGNGNYVWDSTGKRYLDFTSQAWYANIGHNNQRVLDAIAGAAGGIACVGGSATLPKSKLTEKILSLLPQNYDRIFYGCNGSDAIEAAIKTARLVTGRQNVISFWNAYHGSSMAATSVTGLKYLRVDFGEPVPGTIFVPPPYHYRSPLAGADQEETDARTVKYLKKTIEQAGPETVAAVIGEPFNATTGMVPGPDFWRKVRAVCDEYDLLLIGDEVVSGFGRTGRWFARDLYNYKPDIIVFAKGLTSGYLPLSAAVFNKKVTDGFVGRVWPHGLTYSGHTLCCAAALENLSVIEDEGLIENAASMGEHLAAGLRELQENHPCVGDVRSIGLYGAIELVVDRETKEPFPPDARLADGDGPAPGIALETAALLNGKGILVNALRVQGIVKFSPPLTITSKEIDLVMAELDVALSRADALVRQR
jgi:taurine--2-oxoglutarate transaminase